MIRRLRFILQPSHRTAPTQWVQVSLILFYLLIAAIALNALMINFTTAMPGTVNIQPSDQIQPSEFDIFFWNLWWVKHAVFDLHVSPLYTNYVIYPFTSPLAGHTLALLWGLISAPFQSILGLIPTYNGIIVVSFVLAAWFMYLFVRPHVQHQSIAVLAGLILAFTPAMIHRAAVGHLDKLSIFWLPLILLAWDQVIETRRWTWAIITGLCLYLSWLTDFQQAMWALLLLTPYAIFTLTPRSVPLSNPAQNARPSGERAGVRVGLLAATLAVFIIPSLFAPLPQLLEANRLNYPPARLEDTASFAFPLQNFLTPSDNGDFSIGMVLPIASLISLPFIRRDGKRWLWLSVAAGCFILTLGPYIDIGSTRIPLPYSIVHGLLGNQYRTPMRFATPGVFALAMLVSLSLDRFFARFNFERTIRLSFVAGFSVLFVIDYHLYQPFPITIMPDYQVYRSIANEPDDFAVLELPIGVRTGFAIVGRGEYLQYYAPIHQHPIPSGYLSRLPKEITDYFYSDPLLGALTLSHALPSQVEVDAQLSNLIRDWKIGYVILHRDMLEPGRVRSFGNLLNRQPMLERVGEEGPLVIYRARRTEQPQRGASQGAGTP